MIFDLNNLLSDAQAVTVTADSTNIIDLGASGRDITPDIESDFVADVVQAFTAGGAATLQFQIITSDDSAFGSGNVTLYDSGAVGKALLVVGKKLFRGRLNGPTKRYLKITFTVATGPMTAGKVTAGFVQGAAQNWTAFSAPNQA